VFDRLLVPALAAGLAACATAERLPLPALGEISAIQLWLPDAEQLESGLYPEADPWDKHHRIHIRAGISHGTCPAIPVLDRGRVDRALRAGLGGGRPPPPSVLRTDAPGVEGFRAALAGSPWLPGFETPDDDAIQLFLVPYYSEQPYWLHQCVPGYGAVVGSAWLLDGRGRRRDGLPLDRLIFNPWISPRRHLLGTVSEPIRVGASPDWDRRGLQDSLERSAYQLGREVAGHLAAP
jgi:hypothetical protein